jgi:hypothetical protein
MIRDVVRTLCCVAAMTAAAGLVVEVRWQVAAIDVARQQAASGALWPPLPASPPQGGRASPAPQTPPTGRLRAFGRALIDVADAGITVFR